jgi:hypothetical protein
LNDQGETGTIPDPGWDRPSSIRCVVFLNPNITPYCSRWRPNPVLFSCGTHCECRPTVRWRCVMATTLKNLVQKTVKANSVKLAAPADRIGQGLVAVATYPAEVLSPGHVPVPHCPDSDSNPGGPQALSAELMREHQAAMATGEPPAGPAGRPVPGSSAVRWPWSFTGLLKTRSARTTKRPMSRASFPVASSVCERIGDCQSSDRRNDKRAAMSWEASSNAAAAI